MFKRLVFLVLLPCLLVSCNTQTPTPEVIPTLEIETYPQPSQPFIKVTITDIHIESDRVVLMWEASDLSYTGEYYVCSHYDNQDGACSKGSNTTASIPAIPGNNCFQVAPTNGLYSDRRCVMYER